MASRAIKNFFQVASLLLLLLAAALLSAITTMHFAIHGAEVQVPSLKGMTEEDARSETAGLGLNLDVDNRYYSADVAAGHILTQSPAPGTVVRREWLVRVAQSLGPQKVEVPDTVGRGERVAALTLRRVGLEVGATARLPYGKALRTRRASHDRALICWWPQRATMCLMVS
jgi:beta-lactam-binding protein with PASTA domain